MCPCRVEYSKADAANKNPAKKTEPTIRSSRFITLANKVSTRAIIVEAAKLQATLQMLAGWFSVLGQAQKNQRNSNYLRNLMGLTGVPTMTPWVTKLFSSVPMKKRLVR